MFNIFKTIDKTGRIIYLTKDRWSHIIKEHPEVNNYIIYFAEILKQPTKITSLDCNNQIKYYYKYFKDKKSKPRHLLIIVKYLNGKGFILYNYSLL